MKVLLIHNIAWSHYKAVVFSELYNLCQQKGFDLKVIQVAINERGRKKLGDLDLSIHKYPMKILFEKSYEETSLLERIKSLLKEIKEYNPDLVIVPGYFDWAYWFVVFYSKLKGKKVITGFDSTEYDHKRIWIKEQIKKVFIKMCDGAFCYGTKAAEYVNKLGMRADRIYIRFQATDNHTIENICLNYKIKRDELKKQYGFNKYNFIYVGRLSPEKNLITLLKAFDNLIKNQEESKDWGLIIVGDGPQRKELEEFIEKYNLKSYVFFVGGKSWKDVVEYYALADVFILPSLSEPWGLVVNEAMLCGLPVVVSRRAGSYWDLVKEGINGFGFDPLNQKELENIMLKFIMGKVDMKKMGEASKEIIKEYTPQNAAMQMLKGIEDILKLKK